MFVSHKLSPSKKTFQKPNILRRKPKVASIRHPLTATSSVDEEIVEFSPKSAMWADKPQVVETLTLELAPDGGDVTAVKAEPGGEGEGETELVEELAWAEAGRAVDVEAFLTGAGAAAEYKAQYQVHTKLENDTIEEWHVDFEDGVMSYSGPSAAGAAEPAALLADYKCPEPSCNKVFATEQKLRRHRGVHAAAPGPAPAPAPDGPAVRRPPRAVCVECPATARPAPAPAPDSADTPAAPCGQLFLARDALAQHLRDHHRPEDAPYICGQCARRFFWAAGLRLHARTHLRAAQVCGWPGCGRVFRQACRLREHARAHTGDRPYACRHPGCGWAFRTASKLLRHARRHTGERRHACACGKAFRRREHLRDHQARHAAATDECARAAPAADAGAGAGAEAGADAATGADAEADAGAGPVDENDFMVRLAEGAEECAVAGDGEGEGEEAEAGEGEGEGRAARTHCTWPLAPRAQHTPVEERGGAEGEGGAEGGEACAVRSDLFLAAAAAAADDSQQLMAGAGGGGGGGGGAGEAPGGASPLPGLGLLDLMQEELLYTDAVDESSFQVLLLREELG